jgi:hypothetical protein
MRPDGEEPADSGSAEDLSGTAPHVISWVAVTGSWLEVPSRLVAALDIAEGVRAVAVRAVEGAGPAEPPGMILAGTVAGRTWRRDVPERDVPATIKVLDTRPDTVDRLSRGEDPGIGRRSDRRAVLVGDGGDAGSRPGQDRPTAAAVLADALHDSGRRGRRPATDVFEGCDAEPFAVVLPWGIVLGHAGLDPDWLVHAVEGVLAGRPLVDGYRGRSTYPPPVQVAEAAARRHLAIVSTNAGPDDVRVHGADPVRPPDGDLEQYLVRLQHTGGRTIRVLVTRDSVAGGPPVWVAELDADPPSFIPLPV